MINLPNYDPNRCIVIHSNSSHDSLCSHYLSLKIAEQLCNENKNTMLVLDDVAKQIKHEKEIGLPSSIIVYYKIEYFAGDAECHSIHRVIQ